ncbi:MAG: hypothetical protein QW793_04705 [Candidatus Caldarchaeum sp.]
MVVLLSKESNVNGVSTPLFVGAEIERRSVNTVVPRKPLSFHPLFIGAEIEHQPMMIAIPA